ncbi:MAG: response regulator [Treponema sp.]|jgi:PleD family two-component response regulator|nr:response regulator [Treponema sp.]
MNNEKIEKKKILLVDDDEIQHAIVEKMICDEYDLLKTTSGDEALKYLCSRDCIPDLILLDIFMPDMNGWEIFSRIKAISLLKNVHIAFFTSLHEPEDEKRAYEMGAVDFITKPYKREDLLKRIKNIIEKD